MCVFVCARVGVLVCAVCIKVHACGVATSYTLPTPALPHASHFCVGAPNSMLVVCSQLDKGGAFALVRTQTCTHTHAHARKHTHTHLPSKDLRYQCFPWPHSASVLATVPCTQKPAGVCTLCAHRAGAKLLGVPAGGAVCVPAPRCVQPEAAAGQDHGPNHIILGWARQQPQPNRCDVSYQCPTTNPIHYLARFLVQRITMHHRGHTAVAWLVWIGMKPQPGVWHLMAHHADKLTSIKHLRSWMITIAWIASIDLLRS
eukprot:scaffold158974_cov27-Tisochrysis_lutea.AAC.1